MSASTRAVMDANEAVASAAYRLNEVIAIYPITPASPMGEHADEWAADRRPNAWGSVPDVVEMQSEGGAAGAVHGALQAGALTTTFTASQGLLLMLPNLYKIAGELTPFCLHVAARAVATHALSIFGEHSDVMACRQAGLALLASSSVQQAHDLAIIAQAATLESRVPFLHFFDGFRTSHELQAVHLVDDDALRALVDRRLVDEHRDRALTPDRPVVRGTAQNPDVFFQAREAANSFYLACPDILERVMERFAEATGRRHRLFEYHGHPEAERVVVVMGSGAETARETVDWLTGRDEKVGVLSVHLYRPFSAERLLAALPESARRVAVLDRTKEPGSHGEPLFLDVLAAVSEAGRDATVVGGRYGLGSKEFTPAMVKAVLDELSAEQPRRRFTVGIQDDVTQTSLSVPDFEIEPEDTVRAVFFGLGSDGTVGANKNSIKIIGQSEERHVQGYFVYDSKKSGAVTVSHLRFGPRPIRSAYTIGKANFVACHQAPLLERLDVLEHAEPGATVLLNSPGGPDGAWDRLPREVQEEVIRKGLRLHVIDADHVAREAGLGPRINTVMQACFFALSNVMPVDEAITEIKAAIEATYGKRGRELVERNHAAVDAALANLHPVQVPDQPTTDRMRPPVVSDDAPDFVKAVTALMLAGRGDRLPVSAFPVDGTWPVGTSRWEKRGIAHEIPEWDEGLCIQCNKCALICPHAAIRVKAYPEGALDGAPEGFQHAPFRDRTLKGLQYSVQVAPEDCTGCGLCIEVCPAKDKANPRHRALDPAPLSERLSVERERYAFFLDIPEIDRADVALDNKGSQLLEPLFEYSGACAGCGETPYVKLLTQLFGDRALIANATGCSSIFGGNLPTTPYAANAEGRGPAWSNSLFEDNAEFGLGFRLAVDQLGSRARELAQALAPRVGETLVNALLDTPQDGEAAVSEQRRRVYELLQRLSSIDEPRARELSRIADYLVRKSVWLVGGDGWAYDIGYGGLDHVLSLRRDVNVLVLDTEVYSNTGGQQSKATPLGAAAKFASAGKGVAKKDLGLEAMSYGHVYVASVALGAKDQQTVRAFLEADAYDGPSIIIAYSHCIAHGYDLRHGSTQQRLAVKSGAWPLYRFDPRRIADEQPPLLLDSGEPSIRLADYMRGEARFRIVERKDPERFRRLLRAAQESVHQRHAVYRQLAGLTIPVPAAPEAE